MNTKNIKILGFEILACPTCKKDSLFVEVSIEQEDHPDIEIPKGSNEKYLFCSRCGEYLPYRS